MEAIQRYLYRTCLLVGVFFMHNTSQSQTAIANFGANDTTGCPPLIVNFTNISTGIIDSVFWDFGNGNTSKKFNASTTYFDPGSYTVKLTVYSATGSNTMVKPQYIQVYETPISAFIANPLNGCYPLPVSFLNNSNVGADLTPIYFWDFGDGTSSTEASPIHTYNNSGVFDIALKVTSTYGCTNTSARADYVRIDNGVIADFIITNIDVCKTPANVNFKNKSTSNSTISYLWDFGDGSATSTELSPFHKYQNQGTYTVTLQATTDVGCTDTMSMEVIIGFPSSSFSAPDTLCTGQSATFFNTSVPRPVSCTWSFSNGEVSNEFNPTILFSSPGTYTATLINEFSTSCKDTAGPELLRVFSGPSVDFYTEDTANCTAPYTVQFKNNSVSANSYRWDFGDGTTSSAREPAHTYTRSGIYTVVLTAYNVSGCKEVLIKNDYIVIQPVQIIGISNLPDSGCIPHAIFPKVVLNVNARIKSILWDFGDGATSTAMNPSHQYTREGAYDITVVVTTFDGCTDIYTRYAAVLVGHKPNADFITDPPEICAAETVNLISTSTNGPIDFLSWNFGPLGDASLDSIYEYEPPDTGYISLSLVAYNFGCADTVIYDDLLYVRPPVAKFQYETNCDDRLSVLFEDKSQGEIYRVWSFGDGTTDTLENVTHSYLVPGSYEVEIISTNGICSDTTTKDVTVINEIGLLSFPGKEFCRNTSVNFDILNVVDSNISTTKWDFGDGKTITVYGTKSSHNYIESGKYFVTATMTDINGCEYVYQAPDSISIYGPVAKLSSNDPDVCKNSIVSFNNISTSDGLHPITTWTWNYGNGQITNYSAPPFESLYKDTGIFTIRLTVMDAYGCVDSVRKNNYINVTFPYPSYLSPDSVICPGKTVSFLNTSIGRGLNYFWQFGDGAASTDVNPSYTYSLAGTYKPMLTATDQNSCADSFSLRNLLVDLPKATFNMSDSFSSCPPLLVDFKNESSAYVSLIWDFGDGSSSTIPNPSHLYTEPGIYTVKLMAIGSGGCGDSIIKVINIKGPSGNFTYPKTTVCYPEEVQFTASAKNTELITWDFSDGETESTINTTISHLYDVGSYVPRIVLDDGKGCRIAIKGKDTIHVVSVVADAVIFENPACDSISLSFESLSISQEEIISSLWNFGDGYTEDTTKTTHVYKQPGSYAVSLQVSSISGCKDTFYIPSNVLVMPSPDIELIGPGEICAGTSASFKVINNASDTSLYQYFWTGFINTNNQSDSTGIIQFDIAGIYDFSVVAVNSNGCKDSTFGQLTVSPAPNVQTIKDTALCQNSTFQLSASGAENYTWIGDGLSCTSCPNPMLSITKSGYYYVSGYDKLGCGNSDTLYVRVIEPNTITVGDGDTVCVGSSIKLKAEGAETYQWSPTNYLDNAYSDKPVYTASTAGLYQYRVIGSSEQQCFNDTGYVVVKSYPIPQMSILGEEEVIQIVGSSVQLQTQNSSDIISWQWQPSYGLNNPNISSPIISAKETTPYTCIASNGGGCIVRDQIVIRVVCGNSNVFIPNTFSPNNDGMNDKFFVRGTGLFKIKSTRVFNRWGQLVYERMNTSPNSATEGWDGTFNGKDLSTDIYVTLIEVQCDNGVIIPIKGNITLLR